MDYRTVKYRKFNSERPFGVELEVSNTVPQKDIWACITSYSHRTAMVTDWTQTHNNKWWHIKTDSTCGPTGNRKEPGYEIASYKASGLADIQHISKTAGLLQELGCEVNDNCGLHVHVDVSDFTPSQVGVAAACWYKCENFLFACVPQRRYYNEYCNPFRRMYAINPNRHYNPKAFWEIIRPIDLSVFENPERRVAFNVMNYATGLVRKRWTRNTLELRLPEGTLEPLQVRNWIRFFVHFVEVCKKRPMPQTPAPVGVEEAMGLLGLGHDKDFYIYSPGLTETRTWLLERCLHYGWGEWKDDARNMLNRISEPLKSY